MHHHWPLTGRSEEAGIVRELLAHGGVVLAGRAGVGKTRLARELVQSAVGNGWSARYVAATATGRCVPLGAFAQWADDAEGAPLTLARRVIAALTDGTDPARLLVFVDDAHLLDELSALVVQQLVLRRAAIVIATIRNGAPAPDAVTVLWKDGLLRRLELQPLSRLESDELLTAVLGAAPDADCAGRMWQLTRGNTLFLRQLVDQELSAGRLVTTRGRAQWRGTPEVSPSLVDLVEHQIGAVPDAVRDVVDLVAVAEPISRGSLVTLVDPRAVEAAEQRELIRVSHSTDTVYVGHPMYAEVRQQQCGASRLRRLRGLAAQAMKSPAGRVDSVRRGLLWLDSDLPADPDVLAAAADAAGALLEFGPAERLARAAAAAGVGVSAHVNLAYTLFMLRRGADAAEVLDGIAGDRMPDDVFVNDVILRAANLLWTLRDPDESWRVIDGALCGASASRRAQLLTFRANQLALAARPAEVLDVMAGVDYRLLDGFGTTIGLCAETLALAEVGRSAEAIVKAEKCREIAAATPQRSFIGQPLAEFHAFALVVAGRAREAVDVAAAHVNRSADEPDSARTVATAILGMAELSVGELPAALRHLPDPTPQDDADFVLANSSCRFLLLRAQALARSGDAGGAQAALHHALEHRHPSYVYVESTALLAQAWVAAAHGRLESARTYAGAAAEFARAHGQWAREVLCLQTAVQFDDDGVAPRLAELAGELEGPRAPLAARYAQALATGDADELTVVSGDFEAMGDPLAAADAAGQAAVAYRRAGLRGSALNAASRCAALAKACGATSPAIAAAGLGVAFTRREREIAMLVARGLSNREIAEATSLSVRTVEGHVYRASSKAGVEQRAELATLMRAR